MILKSILGIVTAGVGAVVPIAKTSISTASKIVDAGKSSLVSLNKNQALSSLTQKDCKLVKNEKSSEVWFDALWICKESTDKVSFHYLDKAESFEKDLSLNSPKKVVSVNYNETTDNSHANLSLTLEGGGNNDKADVGVYKKGMWEYFLNVNPSDKCNWLIPEAGEEMLKCQLTDSKNSNSFFTYVFSPF